ncbi:MAG: hypothetical protein HRU20_14985 [Pseudomonadales bacterium]|nr:hypothetical protein [Pseudomonadales bacterium]
MSIERYSSVLANISQVLTLFVVVFGYFYTVIPVFQKEKISEELASIQLEKDKWEIELNEYKKEVENTLYQIESLEETKNTLALSLEEKSNEYNLALRNLEELKRTRKNIRTSLQEAENELYKELELQLSGEKPLSIEFVRLINQSINRFVFSYDKENEIKDGLDKTFLSPNDLAQEKLSKLRNEINSSDNDFAKRVGSRLANKFESGIAENSSLLQCNKADSDAWKNAFMGARSSEVKLLEACVNYHFERRIDEDGWSKDKVEKLKEEGFWAKQAVAYRKSCLVTTIFEYKIERYFNDKWRYANKPCEDRVIKLSKIVLGKVDESGLLPLRDMSPPNKMEISGLVSEAITEMYGKERSHNK